MGYDWTQKDNISYKDVLDYVSGFGNDNLSLIYKPRQGAGFLDPNYSRQLGSMNPDGVDLGYGAFFDRDYKSGPVSHYDFRSGNEPVASILYDLKNAAIADDYLRNKSNGVSMGDRDYNKSSMQAWKDYVTKQLEITPESQKGAFSYLFEPDDIYNDEPDFMMRDIPRNSESAGKFDTVAMNLVNSIAPKFQPMKNSEKYLEANKSQKQAESK